MLSVIWRLVSGASFDEGPFVNHKGKTLPELQPHVIMAHRQRVFGRLYKKGPLGRPKGSKEIAVLATQLTDALTAISELESRVQLLEEHATR